MRGVGRTNESNADVFINELSEGYEFRLGEGVHGTNRRGSTFLQVDLQIIRTMRGQRISLSFAEDVSIVVILFRNVRERSGTSSKTEVERAETEGSER